MNTNRLPEYIEPYRLAEQRATLKGVISLSNFKRLPVDIDQENDHASVTLTFSVDEHGGSFVTGQIGARFHLACQRCLHPLSYEIMPDFTLRVVRSEDEAKALPKQVEPVLTTAEGQLALWTLVEDELLLNLPLIPRHDIENCAVKSDVRECGISGEKLNPFSVLQSLKEND